MITWQSLVNQLQQKEVEFEKYEEIKTYLRKCVIQNITDLTV